VVVSDFTILHPKILVVDDTSANLIAMRQLLSKLPAEVHTANSGNEALKCIVTQEYALILLDVQMPGMDGYEVARILGDDETTRSIPIILVTAHYGDEQHQTLGYEAGAVDFLPKPINEHLLLSKARVFLDLYQTKAQLRTLSRQNELILNYAGEGIIGLDDAGDIVFANPAAEKMLGIGIVGRSFEHVMLVSNTAHGRIDWKSSDPYLECAKGRPYHSDQCLFRRTDGRCFPVELTANATPESGQAGIANVIVFQDIAPRRRMQNQMSYMARYDLLTGLANRYLFQENLGHSISRARRHGHSMALMFVDMDHFKNVNDTLGHPVGDDLLKAVAQRLVQGVRTTDTVARIGGDEFTVILEDLPNMSDVYQVADKVLHLMEQPFRLGQHEAYATCSIGIAVFPGCGDTAESLTKNADTAMYRAKERGRNSYCVFSSEMGEKLTKRVNLERDLRHALERNQFELHYQPKISLDTGAILGLEALIRWHHPDLGLIAPDDFIGIAEETGLILPIGEWVISAACEQLQSWNDRGMSRAVSVAVNLSSRQLGGLDLPARVGKIVQQFCLLPGQLELELTESCIMREPERAIATLRLLSDLDVRISVDDFGTGYSSLSHLKTLPIDTLKIDKSFVRDIASDPNDAAVVRAIIGIASTLGLGTVAEGVETIEQMNFLRDCGCQHAQGYYFSRPIQANAVPELFEH